MDVIDRAQKEVEFAREHIQAKKDPEVKATGFCLYCGEPLKRGQRWCDKDCFDDWSYEERIRRKQRRQS